MTIQRSIKRGWERQASAGALLFALAAACGSSDGASSSSSSSSSGGADGASSGGPSGSSTSSSGTAAQPGSSSGNPSETVACDAASAIARCSIDADGFAPDDTFLTTDASCKTSLYAVGGGALRKYTLKTGAGCAWDRDPSIADGTRGGQFVAADDAGDILTADTDVTLIANGQATKCGSLPAELQGAALTMARDGTVGFYGAIRFENGAASDTAILKVAIANGACSTTTLTLTGAPLTVITGFALDTKGRLHVADDGDVPPATHRVAIYGPTGKLVAEYQSGGTAGDFPQAAGITACKGGMCVDTFGGLVAVDENGVPRASETYQPLDGMAGLVKVVGTVRGPLFLTGAARGATPRLLVETMKQP